tara:strand:- start:820 stop:1140 length:321 start_codon:yes stop_codon:yes gene_type:complete
MIEFVLYSITVVSIATIIIYPIVLRAKKKRIKENDRIVKELLDDYSKQLELQVAFDRIRYEKETRPRHPRKVIDVDFVDHNPTRASTNDWKLFYNEELGVYQKVRR